MQRSWRLKLASEPPLSKQLESKGSSINVDSAMRLIARGAGDGVCWLVIPLDSLAAVSNTQ